MNVLEAAQGAVPTACEGLLAVMAPGYRKRAGADTSALVSHTQDFAAGVIDFGGDALVGSIVIVGGFDFLASFLPRQQGLSRQSAADWVRVRDSAMELCNQLMGRVRNQLRKAGLEIDPGLPRAVSGYALLSTVRDRSGPPYVYARAGEEVFVWLDAVARQPPACGPRVRVIAEGDFVEL